MTEVSGSMSYICCIIQIASTLVASGNKVYLSADSLMINSLGDSYRFFPYSNLT